MLLTNEEKTFYNIEILPSEAKILFRSIETGNILMESDIFLSVMENGEKVPATFMRVLYAIECFAEDNMFLNEVITMESLEVQI